MFLNTLLPDLFARAASHAAALAMCVLAIVLAPAALAQAPPEDAQAIPAPVIQAAPPAATDGEIESRIAGIFSEIESLKGVTVAVRNGVVTLSGEVSTTAAVARAEAIALRVSGVVTVENDVERSLAVENSTAPFFGAGAPDRLQKLRRAAPLYGIAFALFLITAFLGHLIASWKTLWRLVLPNPFLVELVAGAFRIIAILAALVIAMNILGATTMIGTILGGAGVIGIAIGFSVRDTLENYISSIMLSIRQPFRANEHVVIDSFEGKVMRLTSRATVLMTLDGNHLRIPNSTVFKAVILNYTRNPERRFEFELGVDANDDPVAAMQLGLDRLKGLPFVLDRPEPEAVIHTVGDSNIVLRFMGWVNQTETNFAKGRGLAISAAKDALEEAGFTLPEPIYRLRFDGGVEHALKTASNTSRVSAQPAARPKPSVDLREAADVKADNAISEKVDAERARSEEDDLLDSKSPVE